MLGNWNEPLAQLHLVTCIDICHDYDTSATLDKEAFTLTNGKQYVDTRVQEEECKKKEKTEGYYAMNNK